MTNGFVPLFQNCQTVNQCLQLRDELSNSGEFAEIKNQLQTAPKEQKKELGKKLNVIRKSITEACDSRIQAIQEEQMKDNFVEYDPTFSSDKYQEVKKGSLHPITEVTEEVVSIFSKFGFSVFDGPLIEKQWYNFTSVGTPDYHPARGMQDTYFLEQEDESGENYVMRTQVTANVARYAEENKPPFKVIFPGLAFRSENPDATHDINFHQLDMWMIDKNLSISQLVTMLQNFFQAFFDDKNLKVRLRPSYFPFTQPSFEVDIYSEWFKGGRWIEVAGAGPIHRQVIKNIGLDDNEWQGLAFGLGITRLAQLKHRIVGLGQFYDGNLEFVKGVEA